MSDRLTHSSRATAPAWTRLVLPALLLIIAAVLARFHGAVPSAIPDGAHPLYRSLPDPWALFPVQAAFLLSLCLGSGLLLRRMLPPKTAPATRVLAAALGTAAAPILLLEPFVGSLAAEPALPSMALLVFGWWLFLCDGEGSKRTLAGPAGLLAGLALCLDPLSLAGVLPVAGWLLVSLAMKRDRAALRLWLWAVGLGVGLIPMVAGRVDFNLGLETAAHPGHLRELFLGQGAPGWWTLPFVLLALLAGILQRQRVLLGLVLPAFALQLLAWTFQPLVIGERAVAALVPWTWLTAYGLFRLLRGVEQGVRGVSAKKAKTVPLFFIALVLLATAAWAVRLFLASPL